MKFSKFVVLAVAAPVAAAFVTPQGTSPHDPLAFGIHRSAPLSMAGLDDTSFDSLQSKLLGKPVIREIEKAVEVKVPKPPAPKPELKKPAPKPENKKPAVKPESAKPVLPTPVLPLPKPPALPKVATAGGTRSAAPDSGIVVKGVALGAAPLLLPLLALGAGRDVLTKTAARRDTIQKEIAAREEAERKRKLQAQADGGGIAAATVRIAIGSHNTKWARFPPRPAEGNSLVHTSRMPYLTD